MWSLDINREGRLRTRSFRRVLSIWIGLLVIVFFGFRSPVHAGSYSLEALGLNTTFSYDIYIGSEEKAAIVIRDVNLLRIAEIDKTSFLVIEIAGFNLKQYEGFIRLDKVLAILPHEKIDVDKIDYIEYK